MSAAGDVRCGRCASEEAGPAGVAGAFLRLRADEHGATSPRSSTPSPRICTTRVTTRKARGGES
eukprot:6199437-Pleurochrysis_carterae.AAC.1